MRPKGPPFRGIASPSIIAYNVESQPSCQDWEDRGAARFAQARHMRIRIDADDCPAMVKELVRALSSAVPHRIPVFGQIA